MLKVILSMLVLSSMLFAQDVIALDNAKFYMKDNALHYKENHKLVNGIVRYNKSKQRGIYYDSVYVDGKKNGIEEYYYRKKLSAKSLYKGGKKNGIEYWYKYGKIKNTKMYKDNEEIEYIVYYNYDKKKVKTFENKKNGVKHRIRYGKSGKVLYDCRTKYPRLVGKCVVYYPTGELLADITQKGKKYSGFVYLKNGNKIKATRKDHNAMYGDSIGSEWYIQKINKRFEK